MLELRRARVAIRSLTRVCEAIEALVGRSLLAPQPALLRAPRHARTRSMGSRLGGAAVSNTDGRGFDTFRACSLAPDTPVPDTSTLTTAQTSSSEPQPRGSEMGRSRHGAQLPVERPSRMRHRG